MSRIAREVRRLLPSIPPLTRSRALMFPLDAVDYLLRLSDPAMRVLPPNHLRVRTGVGNKLLFNGRDWVERGRDMWARYARAQLVTPKSRILDLGCGAGRCAIALRRYGVAGEPFGGTYLGLDVDVEAIHWCQRNLGNDRFRFATIDRHSAVYRPQGARTEQIQFDAADASIDLIFAISVYSHLLEEDFRQSLRESRRVLAPGGAIVFTTFCMEDVSTTPPSRWTFQHRMGETYVESIEYPEAATGYSLAWIERACRDAGLALVTRDPNPGQTNFVCRAL